MKVPDANENALITSFSSTKRQILIILKQKGEIDLSSLSKELGITKMAVLNHIKDLEALEIIAEPENHPLVFHCNAGKDRTGSLAAVVLGVLGVMDEDIIEDYALTSIWKK